MPQIHGFLTKKKSLMALRVKSLQINRYIPLYRCQQQHYGKYCAEKDLKKCYNVLGVPENSDQEKIRTAYLNLAKKYHPDTKSKDADPTKFQEIDKAFRILVNKKCRENWGIEEIKLDDITEEYDIKHCAPQHRQYLSYNGLGYGTVFERSKQFSKIRAMHAAENVMNHRMKKATEDEKSLMEKKTHTHTIKTKYGFDRVVEDLIQEAMQKGEFKNLKGSGKPLPCTTGSCNPYVDFVTHKLNQVLIDNGFTPEWIMLQKEIRDDKQKLKRSIYKDRSQFGEYPLEENEQYKWEKVVEKHEKEAKDINKKIEKYNLVVPVLQTQMLLFSLAKEADKILKFGQTINEVKVIHKQTKNEARENPQNIFSFMESFILKHRH